MSANVIILIILISLIVAICCDRSVDALDGMEPSFLVQKGSPIANLHKYPLCRHTFLLNYTDPNYKEILANTSDKHIAIVVGASDDVVPYDLRSYFAELKTKQFGRNLIFVGDNTPSSMDIAHEFGDIEGLVFIANMHKKGRGSSNTSWTSPKGDVYLNINLKLKNQNQAGLLPILCALSLVSAVQSTPGSYSKLPIRFSWPISITWMPWNMKIGGVLVERTETNETDTFWYTAGCGLRVNSYIQYSVSKMIDEHNAKNPNDRLNQLELPSLIARTVNHLEEYYNVMVTDPDTFRWLIKNYWVNEQQTVHVSATTKIVDIQNDGSIVLEDDNGLTVFLKPKAERFGFEPMNVLK